MKKTITIISIVIALIFAFPLCGFCYDGDEFSNEGTTEADLVNNSAIPSAVSNGNAPESDIGESINESTAEAISDAEDSAKSILDSVYAAMSENLTDILSALAFLGSVIIMLCYKKGLIPLVKDALSALASGVRSISEKTNEIDNGTSRLADELAKKIDELREKTELIEASAEKIMISEAEIKLSKEERERIYSVLECEVDMLYEIFMAAALPQYLKDNVGDRISVMRKKLSEGHSCDEGNG